MKRVVIIFIAILFCLNVFGGDNYLERARGGLWAAASEAGINDNSEFCFYVGDFDGVNGLKNAEGEAFNGEIIRLGKGAILKTTLGQAKGQGFSSLLGESLTIYFDAYYIDNTNYINVAVDNHTVVDNHTAVDTSRVNTDNHTAVDTSRVNTDNHTPYPNYDTLDLNLTILAQKFGAKIFFVESAVDMSIAYGFSPKLGIGVELGGNKVNIMIALNRHKASIGTPLLLGSY